MNYNKTSIFILISTLLSLFMANFIAAQTDDAKLSAVVIDAGHGGKDPGAVVGKAKEKNIVLAVALKLGKLIERNHPDVKVIYTRKTDIFIPLYKRADIANKKKADLFISIHANYINKKNVHGAETFVLGQHRSKDNLDVAKKENSVILLEDDYSTTYEGFDPNSPESYIMFELVQDEYLDQSVDFASEVQKEFKLTAKRMDRSVKQAGFLVLRRTTMPSVLVETGFINNYAERAFLLSAAGQQKIAQSIYNAFKRYKQKIESHSNFVVKTNESSYLKKESKADKLQIYFSVQIAASKAAVKPVAKNFKGEKSIFRTKQDSYYRYYIGKNSTYQQAQKELKRIKKKFGSGFIVAFEEEQVIPVDEAIAKLR